MKELYQIRETFETHLTGIQLGRNGQHKALCPFHEDNKTKSFSFNDEGLWNCFGCGRSGYIKKPKPETEAKPIDYSLLKLKAEEWHDNLMLPIFQMNEEERHKSKYSFYVSNLIGKNEQGIFTFPYFDDKGQVIAIKFHKDKDGQCRWYTNGNPDNTCKWYNGWNLSLYKPSKSLIIAEGEPDVIKLCSHGFQAICSSHGTNSVPPITPILKEWL